MGKNNKNPVIVKIIGFLFTLDDRLRREGLLK